MKFLCGQKRGVLWNMYLASKGARLIRIFETAKLIVGVFTFILVLSNIIRSFSE